MSASPEGPFGITAGQALHTSKVTIIEDRPLLSGCLAFYEREDYWTEHYYHHCFAGDEHLFSLLRELGLSGHFEWLNGSTGYFVDGTIYPLASPIEILCYPASRSPTGTPSSPYPTGEEPRPQLIGPGPRG